MRDDGSKNSSEFTVLSTKYSELIVVLILYLFCGCKTAPTAKQNEIPVSASNQERKYTLSFIDSEQCSKLLAPLALHKVEYVRDSYILFVTGTPEQLKYVDAIIDVVDSPVNYSVENFGPISNLENVPSTGQIAALLGNISVGTFTAVPDKSNKARLIIDSYEDSLIAYVPQEFRERLFNIIKNETTAIDSQKAALAQTETNKNNIKETDSLAYSEYLQAIAEDSNSQDKEPVIGIKIGDSTDIQSIPEKDANSELTQIIALTEMADPKDITIEAETVDIPQLIQDANELPKTVSITLTASTGNTDSAAAAKIKTTWQMPENAEDLLELTLPETITPMQLLDLAGKHLGLDYVYDTKLINNQPIALKLHGNLQGQIKVKNLYALLETVLGFMNLALIRQQDNLVAVVPIDMALLTQPELIDVNNTTVQFGDTVVTRIFKIQYTDIASVISLLQNMKLSVAATAMEGNNLILVTCQAGRLNRIEELIDMIDQPGKTVECRFRRLYHTIAPSLITKVRTLAEKTTASSVTKPQLTPAVPASATIQSANKLSVFLDIDERTNRILMIGYKQELNNIEEIIDILDVAQRDPRSPGIYTIKYLGASNALDKLKELGIFNEPSKSSADAQETNTSSSVLSEQSLVVVLEETNQLLVRAAADQHTRIRQFLNFIDVAPESMKELYAYELKNIKAEKAKQILTDLDLAGVETLMPAMISDPNDTSINHSNMIAGSNKNSSSRIPKIVLNDSTNALLIKATQGQHTHIANVLKYIDKKAPEEDMKYEIYPLENSSPEHISNVLDELVTQTTINKDDKIIEKNSNQNRITIVPDPNTFSIIVYTNRTNHIWIGDLIDRLDKRRPQVLIDVTLVEVTKVDTFEYDLKLVSNAKRAATGNIVLDPIQNISSGSNLEAGFGLTNSGETKVFYSDDKVQALLTAVQEKNYGRVLAKPKILVDDGHLGQIVTTDKTSYVKEQIQIPQTGNPITTRDYFPIEASIELLITPHISEGKLLRLTVDLSRDDFGTRPQSDAPPDITSSKINTTVFVPDDSTVILGGLVKLNQSKGNSKIPILGDLPFIGSLFRSIGNSDVEKKLYIFLKATIVRPYEESQLQDLQEISDQHKQAFEKDESIFQKTKSFPGITPQPMHPDHVLRDYK